MRGGDFAAARRDGRAVGSPVRPGAWHPARIRTLPGVRRLRRELCGVQRLGGRRELGGNQVFRDGFGQQVAFLGQVGDDVVGGGLD